jgi:ABC-type glycerol-3-phosphate transport system substrate-binding protein
MKRFSLVVTVLLVSLVFATALAGAEELSIRLSIDWAADSGRGQAIQRILDEFEKDNPGIKVKLLGGSQDTQNLLTQIVSGDAPEVIQVAYRNVKGLANYGAWQDLTEGAKG